MLRAKLVTTVLRKGGAAGGGSAPVTVVLQPDETAGVDAYISARAVDTNYNNNQIAVGSDNTSPFYRTLIKFDLSDIPEGAIITEAVLSLYCTYKNGNHSCLIQVKRVKRAWVETQVTWNNYATGQAWQTAGCSGEDDVEAAAIGSLECWEIGGLQLSENMWADIPLTVTNKADLDLGYGWLLQTFTDDSNMRVFGSSALATASQRAKLTVTYHL